jgi:repressor LexA
MLNRDHEYLAKLRDYYAEHRVLPSFTAVAKLVGMRSTSTVAAMVERMKVSGHLDSSPDRRLQPGKSFFERSVLDTVPAELIPPVSNDVLPVAFNIDEYLIASPSRTLLLRVKNDSMVDAGLLLGDIVVVQKDAPANPGDIVVAIVEREFTVKYLAKDKAGFYLKPGNNGKDYPNIRPKDHLQVFGLVVGSFRKYSHSNSYQF